MRPGLFILLFIICTNCFSNTIIVGSNQPVHLLKKAFEMSKDKDSIILLAGIYKEGPLMLTRSITLLGRGNPVLDGENKYEILLISGKNITITGIQFRNSGYSSMNDYASVKVIDASDFIIENNIMFTKD